MNILNIAELNVLKVEETEHDYHVKAEMVSRPSCCPHCGCIPNLYGHGVKEQHFFDLPAHGKRVGIHLNRKRYRCRECDKTFLEPVPMMDEKRQMTRRLLDYIEVQSLGRTFTSLSRDIGLNEKTIRNVFKDHVKWLEKHMHSSTPVWLGIDEAHLLHNYRCVIANIKARSLIDMLKDRNKPTVVNYLRYMPNKDIIEVVCMDMWQPYRDAVQLVLPKAKIIIDKFHVVRGASDAMEQIRKHIRQSLTPIQRKTLMHDRFTLLKRKASLKPFELLKLESWIANYPELGAAYNLKEDFYDIFDTSADRDEALERYKDWRKQIPQSLRDYFLPLQTSMTNWETEIFNYFDAPLGSRPSNAYTEALNGLIKIVNRTGRGYSFDVLRAKMLFGQRYDEAKRPSHAKDLDFAPGWEEDYPDPNENINTTYKENHYYTSGSDISTLCKYLGKELKD